MKMLHFFEKTWNNDSRGMTSAFMEICDCFPVMALDFAEGGDGWMDGWRTLRYSFLDSEYYFCCFGSLDNIHACT